MLNHPSLILCIGSSKSGKSHLIKNLIYDNTIDKEDGFKFGLVFTKTKFTGSYNFLPDDYVIENFDIKILNHYLDLIVESYQKRKNKKHGIPHSFIIFDDICSLLPQKDKEFQNILSTSRHYNVTLIFSVQYIHQASTLVREQSDYMYVFHQEKKKSIDALYEIIGSSFRTVKEFEEFLVNSTKERYYCLLYDKNELDFEKKYSRYRAPEKLSNVKLKY